ncbi:MAG: hypothetical protein R2822_04315 [Spirosomataceae bacterium]
MIHSKNTLQKSSEALAQYFQVPDLMRDLLHQLSKDFNTAQIPLSLISDRQYAFDELCETMEQAIEKHLKVGGTLKNLLIRVDLTEKQIKKNLPKALYSNLRLLSELIIKRELQKVVIRHWYRQTSQ